MKKVFTLLMAFVAIAGTARADVEWSIWEGTNTDNVYIPKDLIASMEVGDKIIVGFSQTDNGQDGELCIGWNTIAYSGMGDNYSNYFDYTNNIVTINITETLKNQVAGSASYLEYYWYSGDSEDSGWKTRETTSAGDLRIRANGSLEFSSIILKKKKSFIVKSYDVSAKITNWSGSTNVYPSGLTSDDYLYFDATVDDTQSDWQAQLGGLGTIGVVGGFWFPVTTYYSTLNSSGTYLNGKYINVTGMKQYHPVNSFSIGSIGYATFSADQQVTAPASVKAYKGNISGDKLVLTQFTNNVIPANTGAIIAGEEGAVLEFTASSESSSETSDLIACTSSTDVTTLDSKYDYYILYNNPTAGNTYLSLTDLNCGWNSSYDSSTKTITFDDKWKGRGWGWNFDYSDYSKVVVEFESAAKSGALKVQYNDDDKNPTTETADYAEGATSVEISLNSSLKNNIYQIYLTASEASTLTLTNAYLVSNAGSQKAEFRKTNSGTLAANKAYLKISKGSGSRLSIVFADDDETAAISTVGKAGERATNDRIYTLSGQEVKGVKKGLYVKNGKKYYVK